MPQRTTRRTFLAGAGAGGLAVLGLACAPATQQIPAAAPSAGQPAPARAAWEDRWDKLVAEANKEGALSIASLAGLGIGKAIEVFQKEFPSIQVQRQTFSSGSLFAPKVVQEHQANVYTWELAQFQTPTGLTALKPAGVLAPLRPLLFRPDVLGNEFWRDGFDPGWLDSGKELTYSYGNNTSGHFTINTDLVKDGEITSVTDLLQPKWTGKLLLEDVRSGGAYGPMTGVRRKYGDDTLRRLYVDQKPTFSRDVRLQGDMMARGSFPISNGVRREVLKTLLEQGVGKNLKFLDLPYATFLLSNNIFVLKNATHPNAAQLFVNWLHTKAGQEAFYTGTLEGNSRRTDVAFADPEFAPKPGREYEDITKEATLPDSLKTRDFLVSLVG